MSTSVVNNRGKWKKYTATMLTFTTALSINLCNITYAENNMSINVKGKVVELDGKALYTGEDAVIENGTTLVPLRSIFEALGLQLQWDGTTRSITGTKENKKIELRVDNINAKIDEKYVTLEVPPRILNGKTMVPLRFIGESVGAKVNYYSYDFVKKPLPTKEEVLVINSYNDALYVYNESKNTLDNVNQEYKDKKAEYPVFQIGGQIKSRDPFYVWGMSISYQASENHPGQIPNNSNIVIENPDETKIQYGNYMFGEHYYKGTTTGKGIFGQGVPVYVFGGPPEVLRKSLDLLTEKIKNAEQNISDKKNNLDEAKHDVINYFQKQNELQSNLGTDSELQKAQAAIAFYDLAKKFQDVDLLNQAKSYLSSKSDKAAMYQLAYMSNDKWDTRIENYKNIARIDPYFLLNFASTGYDYYDVGVALSQAKGQEDKARYALYKAIELGNSEVQKNANSLISTVSSSEYLSKIEEENKLPLTIEISSSNIINAEEALNSKGTFKEDFIYEFKGKTIPTGTIKITYWNKFLYYLNGGSLESEPVKSGGMLGDKNGKVFMEKDGSFTVRVQASRDINTTFEFTVTALSGKTVSTKISVDGKYKQ